MIFKSLVLTSLAMSSQGFVVKNPIGSRPLVQRQDGYVQPFYMLTDSAQSEKEPTSPMGKLEEIKRQSLEQLADLDIRSAVFTANNKTQIVLIESFYDEENAEASAQLASEFPQRFSLWGPNEVNDECMGVKIHKLPGSTRHLESPGKNLVSLYFGFLRFLTVWNAGNHLAGSWYMNHFVPASEQPIYQKEPSLFWIMMGGALLLETLPSKVNKRVAYSLADLIIERADPRKNMIMVAVPSHLFRDLRQAMNEKLEMDIDGIGNAQNILTMLKMKGREDRSWMEFGELFYAP